MCADRPRSPSHNNKNRTFHGNELRVNIGLEEAHETPKNVPPIFLKGALTRAFSQPASKCVQSSFVIASFILESAFWWVSRGPFLLPPLIRARQHFLTRVHIPFTEHYDSIRDGNVAASYPNPSNNQFPVAVDLYAKQDVARTAIHFLCGESSHDETAQDALRTVVLYVHGGAWGAGNARQCAPVANLLLERSTSSALCVCILSYALYPEADILQQANQVRATLSFLRRRLPQQCKIVLQAHSSGAQVAGLALLHASVGCHKENQEEFHNGLADVAIFSAAPMHLAHHFLFESKRGVALISPMLPAAHAEEDPQMFDNVSPTVILECMEGTFDQQPKQNQIPFPSFLEGDIAGSNVHLPSTNVCSTSTSDAMEEALEQRRRRVFPQTFVMTSSCDSTVPFYSVTRFAAALRIRGVDVRLLIYDGVQHEEFVTDWFETVVAHKSDKVHVRRKRKFDEIIDKQEKIMQILDVSVEDQRTRTNVVNHLVKGLFPKSYFDGNVTNAAKLHGWLDRRNLTAEVSHVRDVIRIVESVENSMDLPVDSIKECH